jgi:signal transduction histidine kinase/ActR/RegA family two-component response regulator
MDHSHLVAAEHLRARKGTLLSQWRELVRADSRLPERRLTFTEEELEDHLPALLDSIVQSLQREEPISEDAIRQRAARHGTTRRAQGYSITQVIWEFAIFRKLLREAIERFVPEVSPEQRFDIGETVLALTDHSEIGSVEQYVEEARQERDAAREELRKADEQKDRFLAVLSHELRNPLSSINTAAHILQTGNSSISARERERALEIIVRQARYQTRLIDDLLDLNRISQGRIELRRAPIDLRQAIRNVIDTYLPAIEAKSISVRVDSPGQEVPVFADLVRIEQVISNLLTNSLKFTKSGGSIEIALRQDDDRAILSVRDTGAGIEPSQLISVFDLFSQAQAGKKDDGMGIGLWLAKHLVEMHGGSIRAKSDGTEKGTEVIVELACITGRAAARTGKRVLLVEDDPDQRELLAIALREIDAEIVGAKDGAEAIAASGEKGFDVCILDLNLPDISGYELVGRLIEIHGERHPLMIALTGYGRAEDQVKVKAAGFQYHLVKPADIEQLQRIISQAQGTE